MLLKEDTARFMSAAFMLSGDIAFGIKITESGFLILTYAGPCLKMSNTTADTKPYGSSFFASSILSAHVKLPLPIYIRDAGIQTSLMIHPLNASSSICVNPS